MACGDLVCMSRGGAVRLLCVLNIRRGYSSASTEGTTKYLQRLLLSFCSSITMEGPFEIGDHVQVVSEDRKSHKRGTVSWVDESSVDVVYEGRNQLWSNGKTRLMEQTEEAGLSYERVTLASNISLDESKFDSPAEVSKAIATEHFLSRDYVAAYNEYCKALRTLVAGAVDTNSEHPMEKLVGSTVFVRDDERYSVATVAMADDKAYTVDVMFDSDEDREEEGVPAHRIVAISPDTLVDPTVGQLQCNLYLNLARCSAKLNDNAEAVVFCTLAAAVANYVNQETKRMRKSLKREDEDDATTEGMKVDVSSITVSKETWIKAFYLRAKCHLNMRHFKQARLDANKVLKLDDSNKDALKLLASIDGLKERALRKDKKLVEEVCKMVDGAMNSKK